MIVTLNDEDGLALTLGSINPVVSQAGTEVEVVVADGGSARPVDGVVKRLAPAAMLISSNDGGVYQGMNKGMGATTGDFVWFLNGGDSSLVQDWPRLRAMLIKNRGALLLNDYAIEYQDGTLIERRARPLGYIKHALPTSHQAIFYPGEIARRLPYDPNYSVSGDYAFTAAIVATGVAGVRTSIPVAVFRPGGLSTVRMRDIATQADMVQRRILHLAWPLRIGSQSLFLLSRLRARRRVRRAESRLS